MEAADSLILAIENIRGTGVRITNSQPVFGGDINSAYKLTLSDGSVIFMKANSRQKLAIFEGEAESLNFIKQTKTVRSPEVLALGTDSDISFLLLEFIISGPASGASSEELGIGLARYDV